MTYSPRTIRTLAITGIAAVAGFATAVLNFSIGYGHELAGAALLGSGLIVLAVLAVTK